MKKISLFALFSLSILGGLAAATPAFAADGTEAGSQQVVNGTDTANIEVHGTLGANNTDPGATIPEGDDSWINVSVPTTTIFYNTAANSAIQAPNYTIKNNSGRPVDIKMESFTAKAGNPTTLPDGYNLNLSVGGSNTISLINAGTIQADLADQNITTLANSSGQMASTDPVVDTPTNNSTGFTYTGSANATEQLKVNYDLTLKFDAVSWN